MYTVKPCRHRLAERGMTLIEVVIFIVIVGVAIAGVVLLMNMTTRHSGDPQLRKQAIAIAESLLEEVEMAHYTYCDPADAQAPFATAAVVGAAGPQPVGSSAASGGCTNAASIEQVGPESGNARPYDNINDYVSALGAPQSIAISDVNGTAITGFAGTYSATLAVAKATLPGMATDPGANTSLGSALLITVTVTYQGGSVTLDGYRTQYAPQLIP
jgi:MSHA pilin protein MshD